jgi:hypothetical protein
MFSSSKIYIKKSNKSVILKKKLKTRWALLLGDE